VYFAARIIAAALAISITQGVVLARWRLRGKSWFAICFCTFMGAFVVELWVTGSVASLLPADQSRSSLWLHVLAMVTLWSVFGGITGWLLWGRLNVSRTSAVTPA
jgi:hypothetical protein